MKKLNKKGFTLVELLAVIVILAVIMVITIPTVLNSMGDAKQKAFDTAVTTVQDYMKKQIEACKLGGGMVDYEETLFDSNCVLKNNVSGTIITNAGYDGQIKNIEYDRVSGTIYAAEPGDKEFSGTNKNGNANSPYINSVNLIG